eukprot:scaffold134857_cov33-Tisochrysis_lutea.AAC.2
MLKQPRPSEIFIIQLQQPLTAGPKRGRGWIFHCNNSSFQAPCMNRFHGPQPSKTVEVICLPNTAFRNSLHAPLEMVSGHGIFPRPVATSGVAIAIGRV